MGLKYNLYLAKALKNIYAFSETEKGEQGRPVENVSEDKGKKPGVMSW